MEARLETRQFPLFLIVLGLFAGCGGGGDAGAPLPFTHTISNVVCNSEECGCPKGATCEGECGNGCKVKCSDSTCNITAGSGSFILCAGAGAKCNLTLGKDAVAECEFGASCVLKCSSTCNAVCEEGVDNCSLTCGNAPPIVTKEPGECK